MVFVRASTSISMIGTKSNSCLSGTRHHLCHVHMDAAFDSAVRSAHVENDGEEQRLWGLFAVL